MFSEQPHTIKDKRPFRVNAMGFNTDVIKKAWCEMHPAAFKIVKDVPYLALPVRSGRQRTVVCDAASWLYLRGSPFTTGHANTFGDWLDQARFRIQHYLKDAQRVVVLFDCYCDPAKRYLRDRLQEPKKDKEGQLKPPKQPPKTPVEGFRQFLITESRRYHDNMKNSLPERGEGDIDDINIVLPGSWPGSQYSFYEYLSNSEFKNHFFIPLVCRNLHIGLQIPHGKEVLIRGPSTALLVKGSGVEESLPTALGAPMGEPDAMIGYWMKVWPDNDFLVDSEDGDSLTNLLLTSSLRQKPNQSLEPVLKPEHIFQNTVLLMRNQWDTRFSNTVVDINRLWMDMYLQASALYTGLGVKLRNPIGDQVVLAYLAGKHDFVDERLLPKIGTIALFTTYLKFIYAWSTGLTLQHLTNGRYTGFYVDAPALCAFVIYCYRHIFKDANLDHTNPEEAFEIIGAHFARLSLPRAPTLHTVQQLAVQLTWSLNYYANGCYGAPIARSFALSNGKSKYGWRMLAESKEVVPTLDVDMRWLLDITHPDWRPKEPAVVFPFTAPQPDIYNQMDPVLSS